MNAERTQGPDRPRAAFSPMRVAPRLVAMMLAGCGASTAPSGASDAGAVGPHECPVVGGDCPEECMAQQGAPLDAVRRCQYPHQVILCRSRIEGGVEAFAACAVEIATGTVHAFSYDSATAGLPRWRACDESERALWRAATSNPCL